MLSQLLITVMVTFLGWFQHPAAPTSTRLIVPQLEKGTIEGNTYRNPSIGLELTADPSLKFQPAQLRDSGTERESLIAAAFGKPKRGKATEGTQVGRLSRR